MCRITAQVISLFRFRYLAISRFRGDLIVAPEIVDLIGFVNPAARLLGARAIERRREEAYHARCNSDMERMRAEIRYAVVWWGVRWLEEGG